MTLPASVESLGEDCFLAIFIVLSIGEPPRDCCALGDRFIDVVWLSAQPLTMIALGTTSGSRCAIVRLDVVALGAPVVVVVHLPVAFAFGMEGRYFGHVDGSYASVKSSLTEAAKSILIDLHCVPVPRLDSIGAGLKTKPSGLDHLTAFSRISSHRSKLCAQSVPKSQRTVWLSARFTLESMS